MALRLRRRPAGALASDAFGGFYERHSEAVLAFFARRTYESEVAVDLTAETFAQAFLSRGKFRGGTDEEAAAWLFGIARHQLSRYLRRGVAERRAVDRLGIQMPQLSTSDYERIEELAGTDEIRAAARNGLAELSESERAAVRLRVVDELSYAEVAERLAISEAAARARTSRGLRSLADAVAGPQKEVNQ